MRWLLVSLPLDCTMYTFFPRTESWMSTSDSPGGGSSQRSTAPHNDQCLKKFHPKVRNHGEGPY